MTESRFDPVQEFISLRDNISRAIGQGLKNAAGITANFPAVDIYETDDMVIISTEPLVGAVASSIEVNMDGNSLILQGETRPEQDISESSYIRRELTFGPFLRIIPIPRAVKPGEATASFKHGVLTITLPKVDTQVDQIVEVTPAE